MTVMKAHLSVKLSQQEHQHHFGGKGIPDTGQTVSLSHPCPLCTTSLEGHPV